MKSFNKLILEPYKSDRSLQSKVVNGFATIAQKNKVIGLKLLVEFSGGINGAYFYLSKNAIIYIREETLHSQTWAKQVLEADNIDGPFIIADVSYMEFVEEYPNETKLRSEIEK